MSAEHQKIFSMIALPLHKVSKASSLLLFVKRAGNSTYNNNCCPPLLQRTKKNSLQTEHNSITGLPTPDLERWRPPQAVNLRMSGGMLASSLAS